MAECVHCGQECGKNPVIFDDKPFCCNGCSMVYQILSDKKMNRYYEMMPTPGIRLDQENTAGTRYAYLDNEEISKPMLEFSDGGISPSLILTKITPSFVSNFFATSNLLRIKVAQVESLKFELYVNESSAFFSLKKYGGSI